MARMIPPHIRQDCKSLGERDIFLRLRNDPETRDWITLHSFDIARHRKRISGEIDFLVIIPKKGVLVLEVKACTRLERRRGLWYYGSDSSPDSRGPFKQASEATHSLRNRLIDRIPKLSHILFWSAVIFPYVDFSVNSDEWHPWQVIDRRGFRSKPLSHLLSTVLEYARAHVAGSPSASWFHPEAHEPTLQQCELIVKGLRSDFEFYESPKSRAKRASEELSRYTEEQYAALDMMEGNPRVAFLGPAGTGKTLLAIEAARRGKAAGRRVLMLCFNRVLGKWLEDQTLDLHPNVVCRTLHSYMLSVSGHKMGEENETAVFWKDELPLSASEALLDDRSEKHFFDEIVLDEAQDIITHDNYFEFLDLSLKGGLSSGRWRFFGDFEQQAIYGMTHVNIRELLNRRVGHVPICSLRVNCRNTPRIAGFTRLLGGLDPDYSRILRPDDGIEPELRYYENPTRQQTLLVESLESI